jgi:hypothetical protein
MKMVITDYKLKYGLMDWEQRHRIQAEIEKNGHSIILVDYDNECGCGKGCGCGGRAKFPFNISTQSLVKNNRLIQIISRYESGPKAIYRIVKIQPVVKGAPILGCARKFWELTIEKPLKIRKKSKKS